MNTWQLLDWTSAAESRKGVRRVVNEDAFLDSGETGLWAVADGMGGHDAGDVASAAIRDELAGLALAPTINECIARIETGLRRVNTRLRTAAEARGPDSVIGSTFAALLIRGRHAVCLWSGDSRAYLARDGSLYLLTRDHKLVHDLVEAGEIQASDADGHPQRHVITRAIGAEETVRLDLNHVTLAEGDRLLLCTDGLSDKLDPAAIALGMTEPPETCVRWLMDASDRAGRTDDSTAIAIAIGPSAAIDPRVSAR